MSHIRTYVYKMVMTLVLVLSISIPALAAPVQEVGDNQVKAFDGDINVTVPQFREEVAQEGPSLDVTVVNCQQTLLSSADECNACTAAMESEDSAMYLADSSADAPMDPGRDIEYRIGLKCDQAWT